MLHRYPSAPLRVRSGGGRSLSGAEVRSVEVRWPVAEHFGRVNEYDVEVGNFGISGYSVNQTDVLHIRSQTEWSSYQPYCPLLVYCFLFALSSHHV